MYFSVKIQGGEELAAKLAKMEPKVANRLIRGGLKKAMNPILSAAKSNANTMVGGDMGSLIARNLIMGTPTKRRGSYKQNVWIDPNAAMLDKASFKHITKQGIRHYIPAAIEYGHAAPNTSKLKGKKLVSGKKTVPAIPYMRTAADSNKDLTLMIAKNEIIKAIEGH